MAVTRISDSYTYKDINNYYGSAVLRKKPEDAEVLEKLKYLSLDGKSMKMDSFKDVNRKSMPESAFRDGRLSALPILYGPQPYR